MQFPKASRERLMLAPSTSLTPRFWVAAALWHVYVRCEEVPVVLVLGDAPLFYPCSWVRTTTVYRHQAYYSPSH